MISKEEAKKAIKVVFNSECHKCYFPKKRTCRACLDANKKIIKKYIEQLENKVREQETDKQKLIDKLEAISYDLEYDRRLSSYSYLKDVNEILSIVKGESKNEKRENNRIT